MADLKPLRAYDKEIDPKQIIKQTDKELLRLFIDSHRRQREIIVELAIFRQKVFGKRDRITKKWLIENMP